MKFTQEFSSRNSYKYAVHKKNIKKIVTVSHHPARHHPGLKSGGPKGPCARCCKATTVSSCPKSAKFTRCLQIHHSVCSYRAVWSGNWRCRGSLFHGISLHKTTTVDSCWYFWERRLKRRTGLMMRALTSLCHCIISDQRCGLLQAFRFVKNEDATRGRRGGGLGRGGGGDGGEAEGGLRRKWAGAIYPFCDVSVQ